MAKSATDAVQQAQQPVADSASGKKVSQKLIDTIEKRKQSQQQQQQGPGGKKRGYAMFSRPGVRRGRRPKNAVEYSPTNNEEESYAVENEVERIEYDTGIRVGDGRDDYGYGLDRLEDFDEELNFDR